MRGRSSCRYRLLLGCPTGLEPVTSCSTDKRSAIELRAPYTRRRRRECKPSSVLDGHLSRSRRTGHVVAFMTALDFQPWRAACKRSNRRLLRGGLPFSLRRPESQRLGLCCSRAQKARQSGLSTRRIALPRLSPGTHALCSSDFPLTRQGPATIPHLFSVGVFRCKGAYIAVVDLRRLPESGSMLSTRCRRGDLNSHEVTLTTP